MSGRAYGSEVSAPALVEASLCEPPRLRMVRPSLVIYPETLNTPRRCVACPCTGRRKSAKTGQSKPVTRKHPRILRVDRSCDFGSISIRTHECRNIGSTSGAGVDRTWSSGRIASNRSFHRGTLQRRCNIHRAGLSQAAPPAALVTCAGVGATVLFATSRETALSVPLAPTEPSRAGGNAQVVGVH